MKKPRLLKFLALFVVTAMLSTTVLTSCGNSSQNVDDIQNRTPATIVLYYPVADSTTPEALEAVNEALTAITETKLTTKLQIIGVKESEYNATIDNLFAKYDEKVALEKESESISNSVAKSVRDQSKADKAKGITAAPTKKPTDAPKTTELYTEEVKFEEVKPNQIDIFVVNSSEMFQKYSEDPEKVRFQAIDEDLSTKAKILYEYLPPSLLLAGKYGDKTYAIPANKPVGTFSYIGINKRLAEKYELDITRFKTPDNLVEFLHAVQENEPGIPMFEGGPFDLSKNYESVFTEYPKFAAVSSVGKTVVFTPSHMPVETTAKVTEPQTDENGEIIPAPTTAEPTTDPLADTTIPPTTAKPQPIPQVVSSTPDAIVMTNMFAGAAYATMAKTNYTYRTSGLFANGISDGSVEKSAFLFKGTLEEFENMKASQQHEYEYILYDNPRATKQNTQDAMYAVSVSAVDRARAMEVITLMNTNKEFKNIFTYGIKDINYIYNDDGRIERLNNDYVVDTKYTGNTLLADLMAGDNAKKIQYSKEHNLNLINSVFISMYVDKAKLTPASQSSIEEINKISEKYYSMMVNGEMEDPDTYIADVIVPELNAAGIAELITDIKTQTNPPAEE